MPSAFTCTLQAALLCWGKAILLVFPPAGCRYLGIFTSAIEWEGYGGGGSDFIEWERKGKGSSIQ